MRRILDQGADKARGKTAEKGGTERERERIAAVVTDVKMPGRSGFDLLADLRKFDPNIRVILCSGSLAEGTKVDLPRLGAKAYLPKPYSARELVEVVSQVLGAAS